MLLMLSEMAAEADVIPPAVATPTPTAVMTSEAPKVKGASARPAMAATPPTAVVVPPVMPAILAFWWTVLMFSAMECSRTMDCHRTSARSVNTLLKTRRPRWTLSARTVNDLVVEGRQQKSQNWFEEQRFLICKICKTVRQKVDNYIPRVVWVCH